MIKENIKKYGIYLLIFMIALTLRFIAVGQKTYLFYDSPYSLISSTPNNLSPNGNIFKKGWDSYSLEEEHNYSLSQFKKSLFANDASIKYVIKDFIALRKYHLDSSHSNLYYFTLRMANIGIDGTNTKQIINRGCFLNIIFFCFSFFFLYKLLSLIKNDKKFISIGLFFGFVSTGTISNTLLIREYALQELFFTLLFYLFIKLYINILNNKINEFLNFKNIVLYALSITFAALSGYLLILVLVPMIIFIIYQIISRKNYKIIIKIFIIGILSLIFTLLIDPLFFTTVTSNGYTYSFVNKINNIVNFKYYGFCLWKYLFCFLFYNWIIYLIVFFCKCCKNDNDNRINKLNKKEINIILLILCITLIWMYIISYCRLDVNVWYPFHGRFVFPSFPIFSLIFPLILYNLKNWCILILMLIYCFSAFIPIMNPSFNSYNGNIIFLNNFSYLSIDNSLTTYHENLPVVIYQPSCFYINNIMYLNDNTTVRFENELPNKDNYLFDKYVLITKNKEALSKLNIIEIKQPFIWDADYIAVIQKNNKKGKI